MTRVARLVGLRLLLAPLSAWGAAYVQAIGTGSRTSSGTTITITLSGSHLPTTGNTMFVFVATNDTAGTISATDTIAAGGHNTYTSALDVSNSSSNGIRATVLSAPVTTAFANADTITVTVPTVTYAAASVLEFSGVDTTTLDKSSTNTGGSNRNATSNATATTSQGDELVIGAVSVLGPDTDTYDSSVGDVNTAVGGSGMSGQTVNRTVNPLYSIKTSTGAFTAGGTNSLGTGRYWAAVVGTYKGTLNRYWVGHNGNWDTTSMWALTSGGTSGVSPPDGTTAVFFDNNSFNGASQTATVNYAGAQAKSVDWTGYTGANSPTFDISSGNKLTMAGNVTLASAMSLGSGTGTLTFDASATLTSAGKTWAAEIDVNGAKTLTLGDALTSTNNVVVGADSGNAGKLDTANYNLTANALATYAFALGKATLGTSTVRLTGNRSHDALYFNVNPSSDFSASSATIKVEDGTGTSGSPVYFYSVLGQPLTFGTVEFVGAGWFYTGSSETYGTLIMDRGATLELGTNLTVTTLQESTGGPQAIALQSDTSGTARTITLTNTAYLNRWSVKDITLATGTGHCSCCTNVSGNSGTWSFESCRAQQPILLDDIARPFRLASLGCSRRQAAPGP